MVSSTGENPIVTLAAETETPLHCWNEKTLIVDIDGQLVDTVEANRALQLVWEVLPAAQEHAKSSSETIDPSSSLYDFFKDYCTRAVNADEMTGREAELVLGMSHMWGAYVGDRVERQSLKYFFLEDCINGGQYGE